MSTFKARVSVNDGTQFDVLYTSIEFKRDYDQKGKPTTRTRGGRLSFRIEADEGTEVLESMIVNEHKEISLKLDYINTRDQSIMRSTIGEGGYVMEYKEMLDSTNGEHASIFFTCYFNTITVGNASYLQEWSTGDITS